MQANNLAELLRVVAQQHPGKLAIKDAHNAYTYQQLYQHAQQVAHHLIQRGVGPCNRVVCVSKKDTRSLIAFWGIVICEAIPVMLDHEDGWAANAIKASEVKPKAAIIDATQQTAIPELGCETIIDFREIEFLLSETLPHTQQSRATADDVCYILLTSGTTGKSKAVQITHGNVLHYAFSIHAKLGNPAGVNAIHASTFAADLGLTNLLVALVSGGMLRIMNKNESTDPASFHEIIERDQISLVKITPSHLLALIAGMTAPYKNPVDHIVLGGEKLSWETVQLLFSLGICSNLYNHYGPTEATIGAIAFKIETQWPYFGQTLSVPLGSPLGNGSCFLDNPVDNTGELFITGPGISIGYFENDEENSKKFYYRDVNGQQTLCYRTGDICRQLNDGNFEFLYRTDRQVKIRGYRIELGEIEMAIATFPGIENAIVCVSDNGEHARLEAYIKIPAEPQDNKDIRSWLAERLPPWKIPADIYFYTRAPYNSNGKIDLNALRQQVKKAHTTPFTGTMTDAADSWTAIATNTWKMILGREELASTDNFFEAGGDSLMAIQLTGKIQRHGFRIHISDLNNSSTFGDFIALNPQRSVQAEAGNGKHATGGLTFSQHQFLRHNKFDHDAYCQTVLLETTSRISVREMALAIHYVMESHAILTKPFPQSAGYRATEKDPPANRNLGISIINNRKSTAIQIQQVCRRLVKRISLKKGRLFIANIFIDHQGKDYLCLLCHHLAIDVVSWTIIIDEICDLYEQLLNNQLPVINRENTADHFFSQLQGRPAVNGIVSLLNDQRIYGLPEPGSGHAQTGVKPIAVCQVVMPENISNRLQHLHEQGQSAALCGALLSAFGNAMLEEYAIPAITIDMEFHGRPQHKDLPDLSNSVAWWATTLPLHIEREKATPAHCTHLVQELTGIANQLNLQQDQFARITAKPADIRFNYLGIFPGSFGNTVLQLQPAAINPGPTRGNAALEEYLLNFTARFIGSSLIIDLQYHLKKCATRQMERMLQKFFQLLEREMNCQDASGETSHLPVIETNMPTVGQPLYRPQINTKQLQEKKTIFLTGTTGFLGIHLLEALCKQQAAAIYCLVRGKSQQHAEYRMESAFRYFFNELPEEHRHRIHIVNGDLEADRFGMTATAYATIVEQADVILHAAADTNLLKSYKELIPANIQATAEIIRMAATGKPKTLQYVSTLAVSGYSPHGIYSDFSEADFDMGQYFISDYEKSKFEAEKLVRSFSGSGGNATIYRVNHIAADSRYGRFQQNIHQNRIFQLIKGMILLKKIPDTYNEWVSFSHVDIVASAIIHSCMGGINDQEGCLHIDNPHYISFMQIADMLRDLGYMVDVVDMAAFRNAVSSFSSRNSNKRTIDVMDSWIQRSIDFPRRVNYINKKSLDLMAEAGLYFPETDIDWFYCMIQEGVRAGFFPSTSDARSATLQLNGINEDQ